MGLWIRRIRQIRCWLRTYHVKDALGVYKFRYDSPGQCFDCGKVGTGIFDEGGE